MSFDFSSVSAPFRMQPGMRRLVPGAPQLTPNRVGDRALREKLAVLFSHSAQALLSQPDFDATAALQALCAHAEVEQAQAWRALETNDGRSGWTAPALGWSVFGESVEPAADAGPAEIGACLRGLPPHQRLTGLLCLAFAEDFAVIDGSTARTPWLAVCLPSHWAPEEKIGRHFGEVHAPVADNRLLVDAAAHLARLVTGADRWERFVWTITRQSRLHTHPKRCDPTPWPADASSQALVAQAYFRTERQTFIPLPAHRLAVFTIHVELAPLPVAVQTAGHARRLHDALVSMSSAVLAYRGLTEAQEPLLQWLKARSEGSGP